MAQAPERSTLMPSEGVLSLHELHRTYASFAEFQPNLMSLLQQGADRGLHPGDPSPGDPGALER
ncbi:hypothetical protein [Cyanobium sp. ATX-6F1]|uniref:hypothetical protein n=1 Tax=Cyanobium sp. ATX-6F1 TaxID=3137388 RepID=UPI0039BDE38E